MKKILNACYAYRGFTIRAVSRGTPAAPHLVRWDVYAGDDPLKRNFSTVDAAKRFIDLYMRNADEKQSEK